ncbi:MAG: hydroxypyruvate isomerase [Acidobacteria bacterium]|nr:MAG: hydroxypyruvate isomerase [Acidobacteriota bacterium]
MNRRAFNRILAGAGLGSLGAPSLLPAAPAGQEKAAAAAPYKISIMLWTVFHDLPFEQRLEKVSKAGYRAVELVREFEHWSGSDYARVNRKKRQLGITFDTTAGLRHGVGDPREREAFLKDLSGMLAVCNKLECPRLIVMSGNVVPGMTRADQHQSCIEGLKRAAEKVEGKNITLLVENIDPEENSRYFLTSVAEGFEIIRAVNHPQVKFLYDFYHEQIAEGNLIEKMEKNIDLVGLFHIADVPHRHQPGTGEINYANIYKKMVELKYDRYIAMEFMPVGDPIQILRAARMEAEHAAAS